MSDFGKRSGMDLDDEPKAKEVKVQFCRHYLGTVFLLFLPSYRQCQTYHLLFLLHVTPTTLETKNVGWTEKARQG
jgi:hypothetical protein